MYKNNYFKIIFVALTIATFAASYFFYSRSNYIPLKVLFGSPIKSNPQISPDGKMIAYLAPINGICNIWVKTLVKDDDRAITTQKERDIQQYFWSYDNKHIFYMQNNNGDENDHIYQVNIKTNEKKDITPFKNISAKILSYKKHLPNELVIEMNLRDEKLFDVYKLDLKTGQPSLIAENPGNIISWTTDWNNNIVAASETREDGGRNGIIRDSIASKWRKITQWEIEDLENTFFILSRDGQFIYSSDSNDTNTSKLVKINTKTGESEIIFEDPDYDFNDNANIVTNLDTGELLAGYYFKDRKQWVFFNKEFENNMQAAMKLDTGDISLISRNSEDTKWIVSFEKDNGPMAFWLFNRETKKGEFLFHTRPDLNKYKLATMEPISFVSRDGLKIHGYLTCPTNKERKNLPMILLVHGGPWNRDTWGYDREVQWLANLGYAVLQVNFRISPGYGKKFFKAGAKQWGGKMQDDLTDAVNWAISTGIANPKKVAIFGGSYGGYAALAGATFTPDLYCCAIDVCGISNIINFIKTIPPYWSTFKYMFEKLVGNPETEQEFLKSRSPLFHADKIKIPVMVVQGANDPRVKKEESEQIVEAMKKNGVNYEYLLFQDEGHGLDKEVNRMKFYEQAEKFLAKYLGN